MPWVMSCRVIAHATWSFEHGALALSDFTLSRVNYSAHGCAGLPGGTVPSCFRSLPTTCFCPLSSLTATLTVSLLTRW